MFERQDYWYEPEYELNIWEYEIDNLKKELCEKLSQTVNINIIEDFINILYYAFFEEEESAVNLCNRFGIKARHFYAFKNEEKKLIEDFSAREW